MSNVLHNQGANGSYEFSVGDELRGERATMGKTLLDIQRDLRIKAAYIAAIEDAKPDVFPNPSFIPGYVRSYARYLGLDPEEVFRRFCQESGFVPGAGQMRPPAAATGEKRRATGGFTPDFPLARERRLPDVPLAAIGSLLVLGCLLVGLGYGGWMVLQSIQRVRFAPVEELPMAAAEAPPLAASDAAAPGDEVAALDEPALTDLASPVSSTALADLYRQQELEVPILVPRDGPIASLDPDLTGLLARPQPGMDNRDPEAAVEASAEVPAGMVAQLVSSVAQPGDPQVTATAARVPLLVVAERAAWVRVYLANGTVLFEKILEKGESYAPPEGSETPLIWAGNSGSVYVRIGGTLRGPLGSGTRAAKDVALDPAVLAEKFAVVTEDRKSVV